MVTRQDILTASDGMLQMSLYVVFTQPTGSLDPVMSMMEEHLAYQVSLEQRGIMVGAGPFFADDETTWQGEGMIILRANSLAEAEELAKTDPMHASGARSFRIRPWLLNEGSVSMRVTFSDGHASVS